MSIEQPQKFKTLVWFMHGQERVRPGSILRLRADVAEELLAEKFVEPYDGEEPALGEAHDLDGEYEALTCVATGGVHHRPGSMLHLSHRDAQLMLEAGAVRAVKLAELPAPPPPVPTRSTAPKAAETVAASKPPVTDPTAAAPNAEGEPAPKSRATKSST
jgi:hypothetical protein